MRKNRSKHEAKKPRLAKRALALCFALIFVCSCLLPAFAYGDVATFEADDGAALLDDGFAVDDSYGVDVQDVDAQDTTPSADTPATLPGAGGGINMGGSVVVDDSTTDNPYKANVTTDDDGNVIYTWDVDKIDVPDDLVVSRPDEDHALDKVDAAFSLPTNIYHFWLKEMSPYDLEEVSTDAKAADMTVEQYLAMYGKDKGCYHIMTAADGADLNAYKFADPTYLDDTEGRDFAGWYTIDEFGEKHDFTFDQTLFISTGTTVEVFAKWDDPIDLSADAKIDYDNGVYLSVNIEQMTGGAKSLNVKALDDDEMESFYNAYLNSLSNENDALMPLVGLDITPEDDLGKKVQPSKDVTVEISNLKEIGLEDGESLKVLHRTEDGVETLNATYNNGTLKFKTKSFSEFVIAGAAMRDTDDGNANDGISTLSIYAPDDDLTEGSSMKLISDHGGWSDTARLKKLGITNASVKFSDCSWSVAADSKDLISVEITDTGTTGHDTIKSETATVTTLDNIQWAAGETVKTAHVIHTYTYTRGTKTYTEQETRTIRILKKNTTNKGAWVYLYVKVEAASNAQMEALGLIPNVDTWLTIGKVFVPNLRDPVVQGWYNNEWTNDAQYHVRRGQNTWDLLMESNKIKSNLTVERYVNNQSIQLSDVNWAKSSNYGMIAARGAAEYIGSTDQISHDDGTGDYMWHLDGSISLNDLWGTVIIHHIIEDENGNQITELDPYDTALDKNGRVVDADTYKKNLVIVDGTEYGYNRMESSYFDGDTHNVTIATATKKDVYIYYRPNAKKGTLDISKTVTGVFGERNKEFTFTLTDGAGNYLNSFRLKHGESTGQKNIAITVKAGDTIIIKESGVTGYKVKAKIDNIEEEYSPEDDDTTLQEKQITVVITDEMIDENKVVHINVINDKDGPVDNGVLLDTLPYLIILGIAVAGGAALLLHKRKHDDE